MRATASRRCFCYPLHDCRPGASPARGRDLHESLQVLPHSRLMPRAIASASTPGLGHGTKSVAQRHRLDARVDHASSSGGRSSATAPGSVGAFEGCLASLFSVTGLGFGRCGKWSREVDTLIGQVADVASAVPERLGYCHAPTQARGRYAHWSQLHRVTLREFSRCRHAAIDHMLHRPSDTYAGDPEDCQAADDSPDDPGIRHKVQYLGLLWSTNEGRSGRPWSVWGMI